MVEFEVPGFSTLPNEICSLLDLDLIRDRVQFATGHRFLEVSKQGSFGGGLLHLSPSRPIVITLVDRPELIAAIQAGLARILSADHLVTTIGMDSSLLPEITIADLQKRPVDDILAIYVPALGELDATRDPATLQHIVARLRRPDGCPWDRKQDNGSLAQSLVDEVYEVIDAIESGDDANLAEELGDLLLLIMMHAQIAEERGAFTLEDVYDAIAAKIVRRHPHVFGELAAANAEEVVGLWHQVKAQEKADAPDKPEKAVDGQPHSMPALTRAPRVLKKYPVEIGTSTPGERQKALFDAVTAVIVAGDDPNEILKLALMKHVTDANESAEQGDKNASN